MLPIMLKRRILGRLSKIIARLATPKQVPRRNAVVPYVRIANVAEAGRHVSTSLQWRIRSRFEESVCWLEMTP